MTADASFSAAGGSGTPAGSGPLLPVLLASPERAAAASAASTAAAVAASRLLGIWPWHRAMTRYTSEAPAGRYTCTTQAVETGCTNHSCMDGLPICSARSCRHSKASTTCQTKLLSDTAPCLPLQQLNLRSAVLIPTCPTDECLAAADEPPSLHWRGCCGQAGCVTATPWLSQAVAGQGLHRSQAGKVLLLETCATKLRHHICNLHA